MLKAEAFYSKSKTWSLKPGHSLMALPVEEVSGVSVQPSLWPKSGQSNRRRTFEKANIEYRILNIECRSNVLCLFYKKND